MAGDPPTRSLTAMSIKSDVTEGASTSVIAATAACTKAASEAEAGEVDRTYTPAPTPAMEQKEK